MCSDAFSSTVESSFQADERTSTWIGSADLMPRHLDPHIEVLVPSRGFAPKV